MKGRRYITNARTKSGISVFLIDAVETLWRTLSVFPGVSFLPSSAYVDHLGVHRPEMNTSHALAEVLARTLPPSQLLSSIAWLEVLSIVGRYLSCQDQRRGRAFSARPTRQRLCNRMGFHQAWVNICRLEFDRGDGGYGALIVL